MVLVLTWRIPVNYLVSFNGFTWMRNLMEPVLGWWPKTNEFHVSNKKTNYYHMNKILRILHLEDTPSDADIVKGKY